MQISIIITTYNNANILDKCLYNISVQNFKKNFEVIVVDDGSQDHTSKILEKWQQQSKIFSLKTIYQENTKQGQARNKGVNLATGEIIIFIGSDILVQANFLEEHHHFHQKFPQEEALAVGQITWTPKLNQDRFRRWLISTGLMPKFKGYKNYQELDFWHFYTGNLSLKKSFFLKYQFNKDFVCYGWEDTMLGYELLSNNGRLFYLKKALVWHDHALNENIFFPNRMREIGKSAVIFTQKYPPVPVIPRGLKMFLFKFLSFNSIIFILSLLHKEWQWYALSKKFFLEGIFSLKK